MKVRVKNSENSFLGQLEGSESDINYVVLVWQPQQAAARPAMGEKVGFRYGFLSWAAVPVAYAHGGNVHGRS